MEASINYSKSSTNTSEDKDLIKMLSPQEAIEVKQECVRKMLREKKALLEIGGVLLTTEREAIVKMPFKELQKSLQDGSIKSAEALQAFQAKALIENQKTNCITEFIPDSEKLADERDMLPKSERKILHGLPVSIKENFDVKDMDTTLGLTKRIGKPAQSNAVLVEVLLHQGAVPFVKTNVPQLIYSVGCSNPIYGCTTNPHNSERSSGGSSGGEAALIVGEGSVLGIGTDMMGSVRIPAAFCGTFSIKPCQKRISREGAYGTFKSMIGVANASGFLGRDTDALVAGMKAAVADSFMSEKDPYVPSLLWRKELYEEKRPLVIGWFEQDDFLPVTAGCRRAVRLSKEALEKRGHKLVPFTPHNFSSTFDFGIDIMVSEGGKAMLNHWEGGEIVDDSVKFNKRVLSAPSWIKTLVENYLWLWSPKIAKMASQSASRSSDLWEAVGRAKAYSEELFRNWKSAGLDVLLGPAFPLPAPHPVHHGDLMPACVYFGFYNLMDMPAGTMPVTFETDEDQMQLNEYPESDYLFRVIKKTSRGAVGLPLSVQIGALPWQEETVLYAMKELELALEMK